MGDTSLGIVSLSFSVSHGNGETPSQLDNYSRGFPYLFGVVW